MIMTGRRTFRARTHSALGGPGGGRVTLEYSGPPGARVHGRGTDRAAMGGERALEKRQQKRRHHPMHPTLLPGRHVDRWEVGGQWGWGTKTTLGCWQGTYSDRSE